MIGYDSHDEVLECQSNSSKLQRPISNRRAKPGADGPRAGGLTTREQVHAIAEGIAWGRQQGLELAKKA
jgi:hypothetical protein